MGVKSVDVEVEMFETSDGRLFYSEDEALDHENMLSENNKVLEIYSVAKGDVTEEELGWSQTFHEAVAQMLEEAGLGPHKN